MSLVRIKTPEASFFARAATGTRFASSLTAGGLGGAASVAPENFSFLAYFLAI